MTLKEFSITHNIARTAPRLDSCGDAILTGKPRIAKWQEDKCHIYTDAEQFGLALMFGANARKWNNARTRLLKLGFTLRQNGDAEGNLIFNPSNETQARAAIREAGIKIVTPAMRQKAAALHGNPAAGSFTGTLDGPLRA